MGTHVHIASAYVCMCRMYVPFPSEEVDMSPRKREREILVCYA